MQLCSFAVLQLVGLSLENYLIRLLCKKCPGIAEHADVDFFIFSIL
jgi:hypothetical protein